MRHSIRIPILALSLSALLWSAPGEAAKAVHSAGQWDKETIELFRSIPIQDGGRVKPLDSFAAFKMLKINGMRKLNLTDLGSFEKTMARFTRKDIPQLKPMEWFLDLLFYPEEAKEYKTFWVENTEALTPLGLPPLAKRWGRYSYNQLAPHRAEIFRLAKSYAGINAVKRDATQNQILNLRTNIDEFEMIIYFFDFGRQHYHMTGSSLLEEIYGAQDELWLHGILAKAPALRESLQALSTLKDEMEPAAYQEESKAFAKFFQPLDFATQSAVALTLFPPKDHEDAEWRAPADLVYLNFNAAEGQSTQLEELATLERMAKAAEAHNAIAFLKEAQAFHSSTVALAKERGEYGKVLTEVRFYKRKFFFFAQWLFVLSFVVVAISWLNLKGKVFYRAGWAAVSLPLILLTMGIVYRCIIRGRPPVTTLYETLLFITAVAVAVGLFIEFINRRRLALSLASFFGVVGTFLANRYEIMEKQDTMPELVAVLDTNFWLSTHVTTISIGYAAGLLAGGIAHVYIVGQLLGVKSNDQAFYKGITRMVYGVICFTLLFSAVGTVLGGIWANYSWGRFWGWDPKENGALLIVLWNLAILHARMGGYIRDLGMNMAAVAGGVVVAFSWFGVNLLNTGL
ncbi:MAG: cytochrome c biogenesis protein CcsA, partial [Candidatus Hydrogenedentes bacterium]|nr:cytochrome c biogenesis protein CcsA [Candidatus Hydrogenedentota bacterium]